MFWLYVGAGFALFLFGVWLVDRRRKRRERVDPSGSISAAQDRAMGESFQGRNYPGGPAF